MKNLLKKIVKWIFICTMFLFISFEISKKEVGVVFKNESKEDFKELQVKILDKEFTFFNLKAGQKTKKVIVSKTYSYCYARAITLIDTVICQPIDYVGEKLYTHGSLVMNLYIFPEEGNERWLRIQ